MLDTAIEAANAAGKLLRKNFGSTLNVNLATRHDIKLEIDEQAQQVITKVILAHFPDHCILGEEAVTGESNAAQQRTGGDQWETVAGVVLAPEIDELFATEQGQPATLQGRAIHVSNRT